ncbi:MAG: TatD family hydrolase [Gemmiger sp.]|uniref:TatD family hydrolase n=1 Tax=Gemmiger sp. TaxID=2049027 RepID=UPI002E772BCE|nr:TatD family hydrolase [Gemmiger sp.]MEE0799778.1 TatD family hydrolase [Gemmiger sp.]
MTEIFDTHAHYCSHQFDADRETLLAALPDAGVTGVLECATHSGDAPAVLELAHRYPYIHAALGIHPESLGEEDAPTVAVYGGDWRAELAAMRPLFDDPAVVAVGEIGLDHHWPLPARAQYELMEAQLQLAAELDLPVSVHDREAHAETYELLRRYRPRGVLHCYSGSAEDAVWLTGQGMALGFGGTTTYKNAKRVRQVLAVIPKTAAVLETDCPYMAPEPVRGTRNDSRNIVHVAAQIGTLWEMTPQEVLDLTAANARRIFQIKYNRRNQP